MAISLKHNFQSAVADEGDTSLVRPSNWNAEHDLTLATSRLIGRTSAGTGSAEEISVGTDLNLSSGSLAVSSTTPQVNSINTFTAAQVIEVTDNSNAALRITQLGTADALLVEDSANPDATPFAITSNGHAIAGATSALTIDSVVPQFQAHTTTLSEGGFGGVDWGNTATGEVSWFAKSRGGSFNTHAVLQNNDIIADLHFYGSDGTGFVPAAMIEVSVDGTPGSNDMPGRIGFFTTADGASSVTERMRITSAGNVGIGTTSPARRLDVIGGRAGFASNDVYGLVLGYSETRLDAGENRKIGVTDEALPSIVFSSSGGGAERIRFADGGQIGIGGANYGTAGQVLTSGGASAAPSWTTPTASAASGMFWENNQTITTDYTVTSGKNAGTFGPVTINSGVTVTVPSGSTWTIV